MQKLEEEEKNALNIIQNIMLKVGAELNTNYLYLIVIKTTSTDSFNVGPNGGNASENINRPSATKISIKTVTFKIPIKRGL